MKAKINETHSRLCINEAKFKYTFNRITSERAEVEERRNRDANAPHWLSRV